MFSIIMVNGFRKYLDLTFTKNYPFELIMQRFPMIINHI